MYADRMPGRPLPESVGKTDPVGSMTPPGCMLLVTSTLMRSVVAEGRPLGAAAASATRLEIAMKVSMLLAMMCVVDTFCRMREMKEREACQKLWKRQ